MYPQQLREFAKECLRWAEESTSEEDRRHYIDMAKAWMHAAAEFENSSDRNEPTRNASASDTTDKD